MAVTSTSDLNGLYNTIYEGALMVARAQNLMTNLVDQRSATGWMNRVVPIPPRLAKAPRPPSPRKKLWRRRY